MENSIIDFDRATIEVNTSDLEAKGWELTNEDFPTGKVRFFFADGKLSRTLYPAHPSDKANIGKFPYSTRPFCDHDELIAALSGVEVKAVYQYNYPDSERNN